MTGASEAGLPWWVAGQQPETPRKGGDLEGRVPVEARGSSREESFAPLVLLRVVTLVTDAPL